MRVHFRIQSVVRSLLIAFFILCLILMLFPFFWIVSTSLKARWELLTYPSTILPKQATLKGYKDLFIFKEYTVYLKNSLIASTSATVITLILAILIVYPATRMPISPHFTKGVFSWFIFIWFLPPIIYIIPLYDIIQRIGLYDRLISLITTYTVFSLPFAVWMLRGFFREVPLELEEAAFIDGASRSTAFVRVFLPQVGPALFVVGILVWVGVWSEFLIAMILTGSLRSQTFTVGLWKLVGAWTVDWRGIAVGTTVMVAIPIACFVVIRGSVIRGLSFGIVREKA